MIEREKEREGRKITFDMAELSVGLGAELFAPKRRFILADSFVVVLSCLFLIGCVITPQRVIRVVPPCPLLRAGSKLPCAGREGRAPLLL
jgi:hypothetical protein